MTRYILVMNATISIDIAAPNTKTIIVPDNIIFQFDLLGFDTLSV